MPRYIDREEALKIAERFHDYAVAYELAELPEVSIPVGVAIVLTEDGKICELKGVNYAEIH